MGNKTTQAGNLLQIEFDSSFQPLIKKITNKNVLFWGEENDFPNYLYELYKRDSIHGSLIKVKANHVYGKGLCYDSENLTILEQAQYDKFLSNANRYEDWNSVFRKNTKPFEVFDGVALQIIYDFDGKIAEVYNQEFSKFRLSPDGKTVFYCEQWVKEDGCFNNEYHKHKSYIEYARFNPNIRIGTQIMYYKTDTLSSNEFGNIYPEPSYQQGLQDIETNIEITNFHYSNMKNGMFAAAMLSLFNGVPTQEEQKKYAKLFERKFKGSSNTGKMMFNFVDPQGQKAELTTLTQSDLDKMFVQAGERAKQNIFTSHATDPVLANIFDPSISIGDNTIFLQKFERWQKSYIEHRQEIHLDIIKQIGAVNGIDLSYLEIKQKDPASIGLPYDTALLQSLFNANTLKKHYAKQLGIDIDESEIEIEGGGLVPEAQVNEHLKALTGKQWINIKRLVREVSNKKTTREVAAMMLKSGYGLTDQDINILFATPEQQFNKFDKSVDMTDYVLELFEANSIEDNNDPIINEEFVKFGSNAEAFSFEFAKHKFVSELENKVLDILKGAPETSPEKIAKLVGSDALTVQQIIDSLIVAGLITSIGSVISITPKGLEKPTPIVETELYTVYKYVLAEGVDYSGNPNQISRELLSTSHKFCKGMIRMSNAGRRWTREQIDDISNAFGQDAWSFRGGYTNKGNKTTAFCNHVFYAITKSRTKKR